MTIGQRIAQKRKELGLSQEALGDRLGVSRQSIYKWESDSALPEIDKLVALSRLFGVSVGWVLGVEEAPQAGPQTAPEGAGPAGAPEEADLTEAQLHMVEEIVERYTAALPRPQKSPWGKWDVRLLFAACGMILAIVFGVSSKVNRLDTRYDSLQNDISRIESSVNGQIGSISNRVEEILKAQNSLVADYGAELTGVDPAANTATFLLYAVPKTYVEGMTVEFLAENGEDASGQAGRTGEEGSNQCFSATLSVGLTDSITLSALLVLPDGTRQTQLLAHYDSLFTASLPVLHLNSFAENLQISEDSFTPQTFYLSLKEEPGAYWGSYGESFPAASVQEVQVGLFRNGTLVSWAEPCGETPDFLAEDADPADRFYRLPAEPVPAGPEDVFSLAALVTDQYGRRMMYAEESFTVEAQRQRSVIAWSALSQLWSDPSQWGC